MPFDETDVKIIVPCYWYDESAIEMTVDCINTISDTTHADVLLVDDGSPHRLELFDDTDFQQQIDIFHREKNGGFAAAVNTGIFHADAKIYVIANNDLILIQPDWLDILLKTIYEGADIALLRQTDTDGWSTEDKKTYNDKFGALWAITDKAYEKLGPLDERFGKGYFEDLDYWHRAQDRELKIVKNHNGLVEHKGKQTFKAIDAKDELFGRNMFKYKEKWGDEAHLVETQQNQVILVDKYELNDKTDAEKRAIKALSVSLEEAKRRWSNA